MRIKKVCIVSILCLGSLQFVTAQNLLDILDKEQKDTLGYITPAFKLTRITFGHSTEVRSKGVLEVFAATRFWNTPSPTSQSFGADRVATRFALEYGVSDKLTFGAGASTFDRLFDGYVKYNLVSQKKGKHASKFNVTLLQTASYNSSAIPNPAIADNVIDRMSFATQILISHKLSSKFSFQVSPTFVHKRLGLAADNPNNFLAVGFGARYKLGPHVSLVSEYYKTVNPINSFDTFDPFGIGVNWEVGDVLIQLMLTNTRNMVEDTFITQTRNNFNFKNPNLNFGFNATYVIHFNNKLTP